jgi:hypothetical protein
MILRLSIPDSFHPAILMKTRLIITLATLTFTFAACDSLETRQTLEPGTFQRSGEIRLEVATSQPSYRVGDLFSFTITPAEDCHLAAWVRSGDGEVRRIYPNEHAAGRIFRGGRTARFPGEGDFQFRVTPPAGRETLIVIASSEPIVSQAGPPAAGSWLKGVSVESARPERRGEARIVYDVKP